ncbi:MAG TPA: 3-phosphoshikimate 1-carboxyvinyltransferase [Mycobacteriales bacterium]
MPWNAPRAARPVDAVVALPGSKSVTNRALVLGALASGTTVVRAPLRARDTLLMAAALRSLGASVVDSGHDWVVSGGPAPAAARVELGNAGTVSRFLLSVAALRQGTYAFDGDARIRERPVGPLVAALRALGADVSGDAFPLVVHGTGSLRGGAVTLDASASSQLVSGLLLSGPLMESGLDVRHSGARVPSRPHLDMTVAMMRAFGADVTVAEDRWVVASSGYAAVDVDVEPDLSGAAPFVAAAVVTGGTVRVPGWPKETTQPGAALVGLAERLGATCVLDASGLTVRGPSRVAAIDADLSDCGELAPVLAAVACVAGGATTLRGIGHLRVQETDRLAALATELRAFGATVTEAPDALSIEPGRLRPGTFRTYDDHRLAMAAAVLGLVTDVAVENVETVAKTMPDFVDRWTAMLG